MDKVTSISRSKRYKRKEDFEFPADLPPDTEEAKEERYLAALLLGSRLMARIEKGEVEQVITFARLKNGGWTHDYSNIDSPGHVIEALAPLYHSARVALTVVG